MAPSDPLAEHSVKREDQVVPPLGPSDTITVLPDTLMDTTSNPADILMDTASDPADDSTEVATGLSATRLHVASTGPGGGSWTGAAHDFTLHWQKQVELCKMLANTDRLFSLE